jgi:hypothetical protein
MRKERVASCNAKTAQQNIRIGAANTRVILLVDGIAAVACE